MAFLSSPQLLASQARPASATTHSKAKKKKASASRRQLAPDPARIREIQQALAREGYYKQEPSGKWDEASVAAMKNFQEAKGLQPTGKIEALSLQQLGLGSPVAGLAPPTPQSTGSPAAAPASTPPQKP